MEHAPITSMDVEHLFSMYKNILSDNSQFHNWKSNHTYGGVSSFYNLK
jgi:hypothetical protein